SRQVRAGTGLAEELAPRLLARDDVGEEPRPLLVGAVGDDRRPREQEPEARRRAERSVRVDLPADRVGLVAAQAAAEPLLGPGRCRPTGVPEALPPLAHGEVGIPVLVEPGAQLCDQVAARG